MSDTKPTPEQEKMNKAMTDINNRTNEIVTDMFRTNKIETTDYILENWAYLKDVLKDDVLFPEEIRVRLKMEKSKLANAVRKAHGK